jgi:hypothetical protein
MKRGCSGFITRMNIRASGYEEVDESNISVLKGIVKCSVSFVILRIQISASVDESRSAHLEIDFAKEMEPCVPRC